MGVAVWYFQRKEEGVLPRLATTTAFDFLDGKKLLVASEDGFVYLAEIVISLEQGKATSVLQTYFPRYRALAGGLIDPDFRWDAMATALGSLGDIVGERDPVVVQASSKFAKRRFKHVHQWQPTDADMRALRDSINKRSGRKLL